MLKDHIEQLIKAGHLMEFVVGQEGVSIGKAWETEVTMHFPCP